jgi:hypothetical protein
MPIVAEPYNEVLPDKKGANSSQALRTRSQIVGVDHRWRLALPGRWRITAERPESTT